MIGRPDPGADLVASGFGGQARWYSNVQADPRARLIVARVRPELAMTRVLSHEQAKVALVAYTAQHARATETLTGILEHFRRTLQLHANR